eukprot:296441-Hanusia_phi.AAC.2
MRRSLASSAFIEALPKLRSKSSSLPLTLSNNLTEANAVLQRIRSIDEGYVADFRGLLRS